MQPHWRRGGGGAPYDVVIYVLKRQLLHRPIHCSFTGHVDRAVSVIACAVCLSRKSINQTLQSTKSKAITAYFIPDYFKIFLSSRIMKFGNKHGIETQVREKSKI